VTGRSNTTDTGRTSDTSQTTDDVGTTDDVQTTQHYHIVVAECPFSWCDVRRVATGEDAEHEAAVEIGEHVNWYHSDGMIDTLRNGARDA